MYDAFIIARLNSSRLVRKNVMPILDLPMIIHLANRIKLSEYVDRVIITTSNQETDDELESVAKEYGYDCFRGSLENPMKRISDAAKFFHSKNIIEILGDNPLIHSTLINDVISLYESGDYDYAANISTDYGDLSEGMKLFSVGLRVQIYNTSIASNYKKYKNDSFVSSHPTNFIFENNHIYKNHFLEANDVWKFLNLENLTFAVNEQYQFNCIRDIFENFKSFDFSLKQMINFINKRKINFKI